MLRAGLTDLATGESTSFSICIAFPCWAVHITKGRQKGFLAREDLQRLKTQAGHIASPYSINVFASSINCRTCQKKPERYCSNQDQKLPGRQHEKKSSFDSGLTDRKIEKTYCSLSEFLPLVHNLSGGVKKTGGVTRASPSLGSI